MLLFGIGQCFTIVLSSWLRLLYRLVFATKPIETLHHFGCSVGHQIVKLFFLLCILANNRVNEFSLIKLSDNNAPVVWPLVWWLIRSSWSWDGQIHYNFRYVILMAWCTWETSWLPISICQSVGWIMFCFCGDFWSRKMACSFICFDVHSFWNRLWSRLLYKSAFDVHSSAKSLQLGTTLIYNPFRLHRIYLLLPTATQTPTMNEYICLCVYIYTQQPLLPLL